MRMGAALRDAPETKEIAGLSVQEKGDGSDEEKVHDQTNGEDQARSAKKRTIAEMKGDVGEEEMDAYRRKRAVENDPMAAFLGKDELVH